MEGGADLAPTIEVCGAIALEAQERRTGLIIGITAGVLSIISFVGLILLLRRHGTR